MSEKPAVKRAKNLDKRYAAPRYVTAVAVVYDTIGCCCCCQCPEHRTGKIRSELRSTRCRRAGRSRVGRRTSAPRRSTASATTGR